MGNQRERSDKQVGRERVAALESALSDARGQLEVLREELASARGAAAQLRSIVDAIQHPIFAKGTDLRYSVCNPAFERHLGKNVAEILGKTVHELFAPQEAQVYHAADLALLESGGTQSYEAKVQSADGSEHDVVFHKAVLPDGRGGVAGMCGFIHDISELRQAEEDRSKLESQLQHAQKMQSIGQLAGGVAHDLNNLLTPILGFTAMLIAETAPRDPRAAHLASVMHAAERARDLVQQLLAFGRRQVLELKPVDMAAVVSRFADMLRRTISEDIRLDVTIPEVPVPVRADVGQIEQVLMNLAVNARDAMPHGGVLSMVVSETVLDEQYALDHPGVTPGPHALVTVSDTGCGMDPATVERIFEPFFTTKEVGKGAGLGLSTSYGIVKQHGGHIIVYSEPGFGSTFKICLPRADAFEARQQEAARAARQMPSGTETILVVEDDAGVRAVARGVLIGLGYHVLIAETVDQAFAIVEQRHEPVQLLLSDVVMPVANGKTVFERLRKTLPELKVVYMSGYDRNVVAHHGVLQEGVHFVQKPFTGPVLASKVRAALDRTGDR